MRTKLLISSVLSGGVLLLLAGCGSGKVYREESFELESPFRKDVNATENMACEAARRALLGQGYALQDSPADSAKGTKQFQPNEKFNVVLQVDVVCKDSSSGATVFANAVQTRYELKKSRQSTSVSVPAVGAISVPWGETTEAQIKVGSETIRDEKFYERFFGLMEKYLERLEINNK